MKHLRLFAIALLTISALGTTTASAGLVISYANVQEDSSGNGSFEVVIANTENPGGASYNVESFSYEITAAAGSNKIFTDATIDNLTHPYIFAGIGEQAAVNDPSSPFYDSSAPPFMLSTDTPGNDIFIADTAFLALYKTIAPGEVYSLGLITFTADPLLPVTPLVLVEDPSGGSVSTAATGAVPEPSSLVMTGLAGVLILGGAARRRLLVR